MWVHTRRLRDQRQIQVRFMYFSVCRWSTRPYNQYVIAGWPAATICAESTTKWSATWPRVAPFTRARHRSCNNDGYLYPMWCVDGCAPPSFLLFFECRNLGGELAGGRGLVHRGNLVTAVA